MKFHRIGSILLAVIAVLAGTAGMRAAEAAKDEAALAAKLLSAIEKSDYAAFVADGEAPFQQLKKEQFDGVAAKLAPKLAAGHELTYLGELHKQGYRVSLWKLSFKDGGDDLLATLSVKDGKVGGFFIK